MQERRVVTVVATHSGTVTSVTIDHHRVGAWVVGAAHPTRQSPPSKPAWWDADVRAQVTCNSQRLQWNRLGIVRLEDEGRSRLGEEGAPGGAPWLHAAFVLHPVLR